MTLFVDDVADSFPFVNVADAVNMGKQQNERVSLALDKMGLAQNVEKQEALMFCAGAGAYQTERTLYGDQLLQGRT
eukprot:1399826-Pyramimonas_sp.AAC.1